MSGICFEELNDIKGVINQKKMNAYRFGDEWIELLDSLTGLERTTKTMIIQKTVMNYLAQNIDKLGQRY